MANNIIYSAKIGDYKSVAWRGQPIFKRFSQLFNYLRSNLGNDYAKLFAQAHISDSALKGFSKSKWSSQFFTANAVFLSSLTKAEQEKYKLLFNEKINYIKQFAKELSESNDNEKKNWAEILSIIIETSDLKNVLVENDDIIIVLWGFELIQEKKYGTSISTPLKRNKDDLKIDKGFEKQENVDDVKINKKKIEEPDKSEKEKIEKEKILNREEDNLLDKQKEKAEDKTDSKKKNKEVEEEEIEINKEKNISYFEKEENNKNDIKEISDEADINKPPVKNNNIWWKRSKKWWPLLLLFLILVILCLIFCPSNVQVLPNKPNEIIPIDTTKIITDPDSVRTIISDRLNVILRGKNTDIHEFAKQFKNIYTDENYKIIYYDTLTYRLQIQIPSDQRVNVRNDLPKKLPDFELLIYSEGMFQQNYRPRDPGFNNNHEFWYHTKIKAFEAWDISMGDTSVVVAIIDNGFDLSHPEFAGKVFKPWNVVTHSNNVNTGLQSIHGTHVAGLAIGLADNGQGVSGIAPNCKFMPIQVGDYNGYMTTTAVIDGVLYAIHNGANVVNMSLGMSVDPRIAFLPQHEQQSYIDYLFKEEEDFWDQLFQMAYDKNIIFVLAAGNQNVLIGLDPMQRSNKTIKVSAIDPTDSKASFSNYGNESTISAPGVQIYSSVPDNKYSFLDGTSMASPIVAGSIALLKSINPALAYDDIVDLIQSTGIPVNTGNKHIGNIIQLDVAAKVANNNRKRQPIVDCPKMQHKIDSLLQEIEKIKNQCPDSSATGTDTLKIPKKPKGYNFAEGRWKSSTYLYNQAGEKISLYFDFYKNGTGEITLIEPDNTECTAKLSLTLKAGSLIINQKGASICDPPPMKYNPYYFECIPDSTGKADCWAKNKMDKTNRFKFRLIKIN